jgi:hypothetical protein
VSCWLREKVKQMNITRHNYEEYFILYMDNELGSEERRQVESFVQANADLKEELDWLLQSRLVADDSLVFDNKEQLMKSSGPASIDTTNYEEWLLLYTDNELTIEQEASVEKFAATHPGIQEELNLLQKTKSEPEQLIVFPNKELLYRKEKKVRVIAIHWRKIAVAAALLLAIATTAFFIINRNTGDVNGEIAFDNNPGIKSSPVNPGQPTNVTADKNPPIASENNGNEIRKEEPVINNPVATGDKKTITAKEKNIQRSVLPIKEDAPVIAENNPVKKKTNDLPEPTFNPNVNKNNGEDNPITQPDILSDRSLTYSKENIQAPVVTPGNSQSLNNVVTAASVESIDPSDAEPGKKNKLRGFFRKVTRTFEKATNIKATDDEDRLLLGGLAIKL